MEYSKDNTMTRKEYLKSKKKNNFLFSKLKYVLLVIVVILLGVYVFKQLNVYNNVTKLANKVMEETKLAKTLTMYYVSEPYTKDGVSTVMLYKAYDDSRTRIAGTEGFKNMQIVGNMLYGINEEGLYGIDLTTYEKVKLIDKKVKDYVIKDSYAYIQLDSGIKKYDIETKELTEILAQNVYKMLLAGNHLYVISEGKTSKSIIRYNLNGKNSKQLSEKYIVSDMHILEDNIYFINSKDSKIYSVPKSGGTINKISDNKVLSGSDILYYKDNIYYINSSDSNTLYSFNIKTQSEQRLVKKNISSIQINGSNIYYNVSNTIGIYKYDIELGVSSQITSVRAEEFICIN